MRKKLAYIGHAYHEKTRSTEFLIDIFKSSFDVDIFTYNMDNCKFYGEKETRLEKYDALVLFQMPVPLELLKENFQFDVASYFPMYDGTGEAPDDFWIGYKDFNIINFSSTLHKRLQKIGLSTNYIQFFPEPKNIINWGDSTSAFFWNRREIINVNSLERIFEDLKLKSLHLHVAMDPNEKITLAKEEIKNKYLVTQSEWFDTREIMQETIEKSSIYIAPRPYEGIGMSFLEAMSMGRCVISPNNPTMNEYIINGVTGFLYEIDNPRLFVDANISDIQQQTYKYIQNGYKKWENEKFKILIWILQKPNSKALNTTKVLCNHKFLGFNLLTQRIDGYFWIFNKFKLNNKVLFTLKRIIRKKGV